VARKDGLSEEHSERVSVMCAANNMMGKMQSESFSKLTGMSWSPLKGWTVSAGDFSV